MDIATLLASGKSQQLGPVTIKSTKPPSGAGSSRCLWCLASDDSGQTALKIWGKHADANISTGNVITFIAEGEKSGLAVNEYPQGSGKLSINVNGCRLEFADTQRQQARAYASPPASSSNVGKWSDEQVSLHAARISVMQYQNTYTEAVKNGLEHPEAHALAMACAPQGPIYFCMSWFGERALGSNGNPDES